MAQPKSLIVDVDGTICELKDSAQSYSDLAPNKAVIEKLHEYKKQGYEIRLFTARNMRTFEGNIGLINKHTLPTLIQWLDKHKVPYDEVTMGKPWPGTAGFYLDDRTVRPAELVKYNESELYRRMAAQVPGHIQAKTNIVITMGGNGTRFTKAGFDCPKYMIPANGRSLFLWSLLSLDAFLVNANVIFVVKKEDQAEDFIAAECQKAGLKEYQIMALEQLTNGQATSAALSVDLWDDACPLAIYNIDTFIEPFNLVPPHAEDVDGLFPCFVAQGDHWSFAKINDNGIAVEVAEKRRISQYASIGLYWFKTTQLFLDAYKATYSQDDSLINGEAYIAPLYKYIIDKGLTVKVDQIANNAVHPIGTPAELAVFKPFPERFAFSF